MARFSDSPSNSARFFLPRFVPTASLSAVHRDQTQKMTTEGKADREVVYSCLFRAPSIRDVVYSQNTRNY